MTAPIDGFTAATPIETPTYKHLQITGPEQGTHIETVFNSAAQRGVINAGHVNINNTGYQVQVDETFAGPGDYLVIGTDSQDNIVSVELYAGPGSKYTATPAYADKFIIPGSSDGVGPVSS